MSRISLDVHAHLAPKPGDALQDIEGASWSADRGCFRIDGHEVGVGDLYRPDQLAAWMRDNGVEQAWVSVPPPFYRQHLQGEACRAWTKLLNDGLEAAIAPFAGVMEPLPHLPLAAPEVAEAIAVAEIARGRRRFSAPTGAGPATGISEPAFEPLWRTLNAARAFVFLHPGECADGRLAAFYLGNMLGNPYETTVAIGHLLFGGVLERFPEITFCAAHGGGAAAALAGRFAQGFATARPGVNTSLTAPRTLLKRVCVDCITHGSAELDLVIEAFGEDNVIFGSDWPFPMGLQRPHEQLADTPGGRRQRIFCDNPDRLIVQFQGC